MRISRRNFRFVCLAAVAYGAIVISGAAIAQPVDRTEYDLPAQDLGDALRAVAQASGREIIFVSDAVRGRRAPRLQGNLTVEEAVRSLIADTDLIAEVREDVVLIRGRSEAPSALTSASADDREILVTGSRLRGVQTTSPVVTVSRETIQNAGLSDLDSFARTLVQNYTGGQNPGIAGGGAQGGQNNINNSSSFNLRGLGPDATLTLINGHRLAYDSLFQGIDVSAIPLAAIERVEVVTDGASALYGSDAVGGVANIILRRDFDGAVISARLGASTDGGNERQQYNGVAGSRWNSGGFMAAVDYSKNSPITARDRAYTRRLDDSLSLLPGQDQFSIVVAGHQRLSQVLALELDAQFSDRSSLKAIPTLTTGDVFTNGQLTRPNVRTYSVTPTLRFEFPNGWETALSGTHGYSRTIIRSQRFASGAEANRGLLTYTNRISSFELSGEGPLFQAPGGDVRLAIGAGYRSPSLDVEVISTTNGISAVTSDFNDSRNIYFGYGEISVPLVGSENRMPLIERFTAVAAVRYENYRGVADLATPKFGFIYEPHRDVVLRASWGQSFKAPTLNQENQVRGGTLFAASRFIGSNLPANATVIAVSGGNRNLRPERATTWTATLGIQPRFAAGLNLEMSYFDVRYRDRITSLSSGIFSFLSNPIYRNQIILDPTAQQVADVIASLPQGLSNATTAPFDPARVGAIADASLQNVARQTVRGVDVTASYRLELNPTGRLNLSASASYLDGDRQIITGDVDVQTAGIIFNPPHWRVRAGGSWQTSTFTVSSYLNHIGGTLDNRLQPFEQVGSFTSLDLALRIRSRAQHGFLRGFEFSAAVQNLFNEQPDIIRTTNPADPNYDSTNYSPIGRFVSLAITKSW